MTHERQAHQHAMDVALREKLGGLEPPDLRERVLAATDGDRRAAGDRADGAARDAASRVDARRSRQGLRTAAVVLLGLGVVAFALSRGWSGEGRGSHGAGTVSSPGEGQGTGQSQDPLPPVKPKDGEEFLAFVRGMPAITVQAVRTTRHGVDLSQGPGGKIRIDGEETLAALRVAIAGSLERLRYVTSSTHWSSLIHLHVPGRGAVVCAVRLKAGSKPIWEVKGLGQFKLTSQLAELLRRHLVLAEQNARRAQGVVIGGDDLRSEDLSSQLEKLVCFDLEDGELAQLARFGRLRHLDLSGCGRTLSESATILIAGTVTAEPLEVLNLGSLSIAANGLAPISCFHNLRTLDLSLCQGDLDAALAAMPRLPRLESLHLLKTMVGAPGLEALAEALPPLKHLELSYCKRVDDRALAAVARFRKLDRLGLKQCTATTGRGLALLEDLTELRSLSMQSTALADKDLGFLLSLPHLEVLDLAFNEQLTGATVGAVAKIATLRELRIGGCNKLKLPDLLQLKAHESLRELDLGSNPNFWTEDMVQPLRAALPDCEVSWRHPW